MTSRAEVTNRYAKAYVKASKKDKGRVLDAVIEVRAGRVTTPAAGWSRRQRPRRGWPSGRDAAAGAAALKYSYDAVKVLQRVWAASGGQCGK